MLPIYEAAWELHQYLTRKRIPYVIIGGIAVQKWGRPRLTKDVDLTIAVPIEETEECIDHIGSKFKSRVPNLKEFARQTRVVLIYASNGREVDISLALPGYEDLLMQRAQPLKLALGKSMQNIPSLKAVEAMHKTSNEQPATSNQPTHTP